MFYSCWINGEEKACRSSYPLVDPSTGEEFARIAAAAPSTVSSAVEAAQESFGKWQRTPASERSSILHAFAERIRDEKEHLALLTCREVGKPLRAARDEVMSAAALVDFFAEESLRLRGEIPLQGYPREQVLIVREPIGVVGSITPFNYPLSTLVSKVAPALAVGCTVVAKPDEHTPLGTLRMARIAAEAGLPPGVFNVVTGPGPEAGRYLVEHPVPRLISFTGSTQVGKEVHGMCSHGVKKVILELGGQCPAIVCADADLEGIMPQLVHQSFKNSGQYCYRTSRIFVASEIYGEFMLHFTRHVAGLRIGSPLEDDTDLGPLNNPDILSRVERQVDTAVKEGAGVEFRGSSPLLKGRGYYYPPTILSGLQPDMSILREEVFGPVVGISRFHSVQDVIGEANGTPFGLAAYVFTRDLGSALEMARQIEAGSVWINRIHQAYMEAPFGGMKESGLGREKSRFGLEEFTELKTIYLCY